MRSVLTLLLVVVNLGISQAQSEPTPFRNYPLVVTIRFQSLSMPFRDVQENFRNIGIGIGTEVTHNGSSNWVQTFTFTWTRNATMGNNLGAYTQVSWRPPFGSGVYGEVAFGVGYVHWKRPTESFQQRNGTWQSVGSRGTGLLAIPINIGLGYEGYSNSAYAASFVNYQFVLLKGYNQTIPVVPQTNVLIGTRIHTSKEAEQ